MREECEEQTDLTVWVNKDERIVTFRDMDCEDDTEFSLTENTSSQEQEYTIEDMLSALDESIDNDDEECVSDEILDKFDKTLEEKGLGDDYFQKKEERLKEMELEHELHEFAIDEMLNE